MQLVALLLVAVAILAFGVISRRLERTVLTPPMFFLIFGLIAIPFVGDPVLELGAPWVHFVAELALVMVLFTDASRIDLGLLRREHDLPTRLLVVGLPLTILLGGFAAAFLFQDMTWAQAGVLGAILAPTDAALGQAVVSNESVPVRIRQTLNVESGLNDGIALPAVLILAALSGLGEGNADPGYWVRFALLQVLIGPMVGIGVGYFGGEILESAMRRNWVNQAFQSLSALGLALFAYAGAEIIGGNGFISAFAAGLTIGNSSRAVCSCLYEFAEAEGNLLTLLIFMLFGAVVLPAAVENVDGRTLLYALLSLTAIRAVPVFLSLTRTRLAFGTKCFLAWFGPRGVASILFAMVVWEAEMPGRELVLAVVSLTVLLSIFTHGVTAYPASVAYSKSMAAQDESMPEQKPVREMPVRIPFTTRDSAG